MGEFNSGSILMKSQQERGGEGENLRMCACVRVCSGPNELSEDFETGRKGGRETASIFLFLSFPPLSVEYICDHASTSRPHTESQLVYSFFPISPFVGSVMLQLTKRD